ncbi:hypothetical protein ACJX0J_035996 [Zea mays]
MVRIVHRGTYVLIKKFNLFLNKKYRYIVILHLNFSLFFTFLQRDDDNFLNKLFVDHIPSSTAVPIRWEFQIYQNSSKYIYMLNHKFFLDNILIYFMLILILLILNLDDLELV